QSGCCKPPTSCTYTAGIAVAAQDEDCYRWNNAADILCYDCDSCKAGVLEQVRRDWHKLTILNAVVLVFLIAVYTVGCCAFRNARRAELGYPYPPNRMPKAHPLWDDFWWRPRDRRAQLYR
ncbi:Tetraspanin family, partial [Musa troglodytarum]